MTQTPRPAPVCPSPGMLFVATHVDMEHDADFNQWYDQEHVEERVRLPGFQSGTRYQGLDAQTPRYLGLYRTTSLEAFSTAAYQAAFGQQTPWSVANLARMRQPTRRVCTIQEEAGQGTGSRLLVQRLSLQTQQLPARAADFARSLLGQPGFVRSFLLLPDTALSTPLPQESTQGRVLHPMLVCEASTDGGLQSAADRAVGLLDADPALAWRFAFSWQLRQSDLAPAG